MRLLLIEDDPALVDSLSADLEQHGFRVDSTASGEDGGFLADTEDYDAVVLDLGLPDKPGLEVLQQWRQQGNDVPVLVLTARGAWHEKVDGFKNGADDYLAKPFHTEELLVRLQALIRRRHGRASAQLSLDDLTLDEETRTLQIGSQTPDALTATEYRLLHYFMNNPDRVLSKTRLLEHVWGDADVDEDNLVEVYIRRLRNKLGKARIETRRGQGYLLRGSRCDH